MKDRKIEIEKSATLEYVDYAKNIDKVYELHLMKHSSGSGFQVLTSYGRRNASRVVTHKTDGPVEYSKASKIYAQLLEKKLAKGYTNKD